MNIETKLFWLILAGLFCVLVLGFVIGSVYTQMELLPELNDSYKQIYDMARVCGVVVD